MSDRPMWTPNAEQLATANMTRFLGEAARVSSSVRDYGSLYSWSIESPEEFWPLVWNFTGIVADDLGEGAQWRSVLRGRERMAPPDPTLGPTWFEGARLNFAENLLRRADDHVALIGTNESGEIARLTFADLRRETARFASALRARGIRAGDRVVGFVPNVVEAVIAMLGATSIGAVWSSCSPDFGVAGVLDRFGQIRPRILVTVDGYRYNGKSIDLRTRLLQIVDRLPDVEQVVVLPYLSAKPDLTGIRAATTWTQFLSDRPSTPIFERLPFDHPAYIMYSSGTTGLPKCMVHGAGGTLLQHLKELVLHTDLRREDRVFYFTTCGWMMWNWLVSCLAVGSTIVLYDGAPLIRHRPILWDMAAEEGITVFGTSAKWLALTEKAGLAPIETHDLSALTAILSTGSPLAAHSFDYVYTRVKRNVRLSSISGGTDIISCFAGGNPIGPVWRGELQKRALAMHVQIFDESGRPLVGQPGELVCTTPFPSMPVAF